MVEFVKNSDHLAIVQAGDDVTVLDFYTLPGRILVSFQLDQIRYDLLLLFGRQIGVFEFLFEAAFQDRDSLKSNRTQVNVLNFNISCN